MEKVHQGDILKIERIKKPVLVVSKDFFNQTHEIIGCPVYDCDKFSVLSVFLKRNDYFC